MKKTVLASILILASSFAPALASPAQDLFDQATFYLGFYYSGPGTVPNFRELRKQYQPELDKRCGTDKACGYDKGLEVINAIIASLNDPFTQVINSDFERLGGGLGPNTPRLGLITRTHANALLVVQALEGEAGWEAGIERGDLIVGHVAVVGRDAIGQGACLFDQGCLARLELAQLFAHEWFSRNEKTAICNCRGGSDGRKKTTRRWLSWGTTDGSSQGVARLNGALPGYKTSNAFAQSVRSG